MSDAKPNTRERILRAAILRFSRNSYEDTGLRQIAEDVGVDVAYVHRSFGSKKMLFTEALTHTLSSFDFPDRQKERFGDFLADLVMRARLPTEERSRSLEIISNSLSNREAQPILRDAMTNGFLAPLIAGFPDVPRQNVVLSFSMLLGLGIIMRVLEMEVFPGLDETARRELVAEGVRALFNGISVPR